MDQMGKMEGTNGSIPTDSVKNVSSDSEKSFKKNTCKCNITIQHDHHKAFLMNN